MPSTRWTPASSNVCRAEATADKRSDAPGPRLATEILTRIRDGRGGALCLNWPSGPLWAHHLFGEPAVVQLGGTGPQAAWALAALGAPAIVALTDRSDEQLSVLPPGVRLCDAGRLIEARKLSARTPPRKPRNIVLELTEGTCWRGGRVRRSTRIMLRFLDSGIERFEFFAREVAGLASKASACLVSGLDAIHENDRESIPWLLSLVGTLKQNGLTHAHLELAEFPREGRMEELCVAFGGVADSLGMSLSELGMLTGRHDQPVMAAREVAARHKDIQNNNCYELDSLRGLMV
jgi:ADP-specific Phosphofructokinase/Glucokinase conserved region